MPTQRLVALTGWTNPIHRYKERIEALKKIDHRYNMSRVVDEAVADYLPRLELKMLPSRHEPARRFQKVSGN